MDSGDEELAKRAVYSLEDLMKEDEGPSLFIEIYNKSDLPDIKRAALMMIADQEGPETVKSLLSLLKVEKSVNSKRIIVRALGDTESDEAVPALEEIALNDENPKLRKEAVDALGDIGTQKAKEALIKVLEKK